MKLLIKSIFGLLMLALMVFGYWSWLMPNANAETVPQMRVRVIEEAKAQHPDVWNGCDANCIAKRLEAAPELKGIARQSCHTPGGAGPLVCVDLNDVVRLSIVLDFQWGLEFEKLHKRPPTMYDWGLHFTAGLERVRYVLAVSPVVFAWVADEGLSFKLKPEYQ